MTKLYISGPMRGHSNYNYEAFHAAAKKWRDQGFTVINPAESFGGEQTLSMAEYMRMDIHYLLTADGIVQLDGWETSEGARLEYQVAKHLGLVVYED